MFGNVDGRIQSGNHKTSKNEIEEKTKICEKFIPNWIRYFAESFVQLS